ncbi:hypothetical protein [Pseudorhodobacter sp.]|uniref:hypothetical protein n=1 Tax=Pseudorhodobacter sp. TaxID=1934400 RepID=UPI002AFF5539|nr:hypothetical protein [Pseudorhodobacter sp.]
MKNKKALDRLSALSDLILDNKLAKLQACALQRNASLQRLQDLAAKDGDQLGPIALATAALRYEAWADARRSEINLALARQTAAWMEARKSAEIALGRAEVLSRLKKNRPGRS